MPSPSAASTSRIDIARGLSTPIEAAERLKTMHGSVIAGGSDEREVLAVPPLGEDEGEGPQQVPRAMLTRIIRPRVEEILELVRDRLNASGFAALFGRRLVLTGGGSQLTGLTEAARRIAGAQRPPRAAARRRRAARACPRPGVRGGRRAADLSAGRGDGADRDRGTWNSP